MKNETKIRDEMTRVLSSNDDLSPGIVKKAVDEAISRMKKEIKKAEVLPVPDVNDVYGAPIVKGVKVAYNCSGTVRLGYVKDVKTAPRRGKTIDPWTNKPYVVVHVDMIVTIKERPNVSSKVTNPMNLVVVN